MLSLGQRFLSFFYLSTSFGHAVQPPCHWLTPGYYMDKVKTSAVHLDHMLGSYSKTKTAIVAVALTKTIRK